MRVLIPSYNRPEVLREKTLGLLEQSGVEPEQVTILVASDEQLLLYDTELPEHWGDRLVPTELGLTRARRFARAHLLEEGERVLWIDDDIPAVRILQDGNLLEINPMLVATEGFRYLDELGLKLWGIYSTDNAYFMSQKLQVGLYHCIGCFYGEIVDRDTFLDPVFGEMKEDYERCLRHYELFGGVARMDWIAPVHKYVGTGTAELDQEAKVKKAELNVEQILNRWPGLVRRNARRQGPIAEILLTAKKRG